MTIAQLKEEVATIQTELDEYKAKAEDGTATEEDLQAVNDKLEQKKKYMEQIKTLEDLDSDVDSMKGGVQKDASHVSIVQDEADQKYGTFGEFARDVAVNSITGKTPKMLQNHETRMAASGMSEGKPSEGGFLVDPEYSNQLLEKVHNTGLLVSLVRKMKTSSNVLKLKYVDETSRANGSRLGGVRAYWEGEAAQMTSSNPSFGEMTLELKKLTGLSYVTDELLEDAPALSSYLPDAFAEEFGFKLDDAIINGTGAGQPLGFFASNALVSISKETGQAASTFLYENLLKMYARLWNRSRGNFIFIANQEVIPQLYSMVQEIGTGGSSVFTPAGGVSQKPYDTIFGRPILYMEQAQSLGSKGDVYLFDPNQYILVDKGGMKSASSIHLRFDYNETAFRWIYRVDGQPTWVSALTPYKGSDTVSPYITLNARS